MASPFTDRLPIHVPEVPTSDPDLPDPSIHVMTLRRYMWSFGFYSGLLAISAAAMSTAALALLGHGMSADPLSDGGIAGALVAVVLFGHTWRGLVSGLRDAPPVIDTVRRGRISFLAIIRSPGAFGMVLAFAAGLTLLTVVAGGSALQLQVLATGVFQILVAVAALTWLAARERREQRRYLVRVELAGEHPARELLWEARPVSDHPRGV